MAFKGSALGMSKIESHIINTNTIRLILFLFSGVNMSTPIFIVARINEPQYEIAEYDFININLIYKISNYAYAPDKQCTCIHIVGNNLIMVFESREVIKKRISEAIEKDILGKNKLRSDIL